MISCLDKKTLMRLAPLNKNKVKGIIPVTIKNIARMLTAFWRPIFLSIKKCTNGLKTKASIPPKIMGKKNGERI
jgi:hypothetical protein